jgi:pimeloyl-ACP methyl ester carboxylesterase
MKKNSGLLIGPLLALTLALVFLVLPQQTQAQVGKNARQCEDFIATLPADFERGYITVPEDYSNPNGDKLQIFYFMKKRGGHVPIVHLNGGPLSGNTAYAQFSSAADRYNLWMIFADQRGTRCSGETVMVKDAQSALKAALYSTDNIVRDHEIIREHILGKNKPWVVFGQSFGGYITDRYITMYPRSIIAAHNAGGVMYETEARRNAEILRSQILVQKRFFQAFPGIETKLRTIASWLTPDKCFQITVAPGSQICGKTILAMLAFDDLVSETSWARYAQVIEDAYAFKPDSGLFNQDLSLNQNFWTLHESLNKGTIDYWWGPDRPHLSTLSIYNQDFTFAKPQAFPDVAESCSLGQELLLQEGIDSTKELIINHCDLLIGFARADQQRVDYQAIFKNVPVRKHFSIQDLRGALKANPNLHYYIYNGDMDGCYSNPKAEELRNLPAKQVTYIRFPNRGHWGYFEEDLFWQNLSGQKDKKLFGEGAILSINGVDEKIQGVRMFGGTRPILDLSTAESQNLVVDTGLASNPLSPELATKVRGKFAFIMRGESTFNDKAHHVLDAGATGFILANNLSFPGDAFTSFITNAVNIPGIMISTKDGKKIIEALAQGHGVQIKFTYEP